MMADWRSYLAADPTPWLLEQDTPAVRAMALRLLEGRAEDDPGVAAARAAAMSADPIATILKTQDPEGFWAKPGAGYGPKYFGTVWQVIFLDQLGAEGSDERIARACEHLLEWCPTTYGGLGASSALNKRPPPSMVIHCLNGNLLRALISFGWLADERVQRAIDWQARSITGEDFDHYYRSSTSAAGFCCAANGGLPCAWGAVRAIRGLTRIPPGAREPHVSRAIDAGADFLLSRDPAVADYPMPPGTPKPNGSWFKPGFPTAYVASVLDTLETLCEAGRAKDARLGPAIDWLVSKQDREGRWKNQYAYNGKTWIDIEKQGAQSKWVTLRACAVLKAVSEGGREAGGA